MSTTKSYMYAKQCRCDKRVDRVFKAINLRFDSGEGRFREIDRANYLEEIMESHYNNLHADITRLEDKIDKMQENVV